MRAFASFLSIPNPNHNPTSITESCLRKLSISTFSPSPITLTQNAKPTFIVMTIDMSGKAFPDGDGKRKKKRKIGELGLGLGLGLELIGMCECCEIK